MKRLTTDLLVRKKLKLRDQSWVRLSVPPLVTEKQVDYLTLLKIIYAMGILVQVWTTKEGKTCKMPVIQ